MKKRKAIQSFCQLFKGYWNSEHKWKARGLLAFVIGLNFFDVYLLVQINSWYNEFYNALQQYQVDAFWPLVGQFTALAMLFAFGNFGVPATAGFVGEWTVIIAAVKSNFWVGLAAATSLILAAAYTLWMMQRVFLGPVANDKVRALREMNVRETIFLGVLGLSVLWMGVYPKPITQSMNASVARLVQHVSTSKLQ